MLALILSLSVSVEAEKFGRVVVAMGNVTALTGTTSRGLKAGDVVFKGERVQTSDDSRAKLLLEDRSVVTLGPKSDMELTGLRSPETPKTSVKLLFGRLWANVQKLVGGEAKFDVVTPTAVAGVRGTSFGADASSDKSSFWVANGSVNVSAGNHEQLLGALQQINATGSGLGGIVNLPPGAIAELIAAISTGGGLSDADRLARLEQLERQLAPTQGQHPGFDTFNSSGTTPPINLDPQQTTQTTLIRGHVQVVNP